ncbi:MOSC domain-containing protein [Enterovibrio paralichthyis]|uniref:MOSC domain-containing protein n=1 Tax=Enterovibrio paralichthyis TaxID=2853805 RepID=UPI001C453B7A|nr:MOSC domain-containing protein [Enterovibrio paralichthyis]MBV7298101.1 MOSC domain-containing protein [Enterovibrio paralichthyis]
MRTAMGKSRIEEPLFLSAVGLEGDECAETRFHGGEERALHQYPAEHYLHWQTRFGIQTWQAPGMGENISTLGMLETTVCIGDVYQWGEAVIQISQPRSPCYKLDKRWQVEGFAQRMQDSARCGWLYRVLTPGFVSVHEPLVLIERPANAVTVKETSDIFFVDPLNPQGLERLAMQTALSESWRGKVLQRIETGVVENWQHRLTGKS